MNGREREEIPRERLEAAKSEEPKQLPPISDASGDLTDTVASIRAEPAPPVQNAKLNFKLQAEQAMVKGGFVREFAAWV